MNVLAAVSGDRDSDCEAGRWMDGWMSGSDDGGVLPGGETCSNPFMLCYSWYCRFQDGKPCDSGG